jgi:GNAT superfamily N-acetyltransferase
MAEPRSTDARRSASVYVIRDALPGDAAGIARVKVDTWRAAYAGIIPAAFLAGLSYEHTAHSWRAMLARPEPGEFTLIALAGAGSTVGFAAGGPQRGGDPEYTGEIYALYVLPAYQGRGLGRRLVSAAAARLQAIDRTTLLIWVLAENSSRHFYAALGGQPVRTQRLTIGGVELEEVGYGWTELPL